MRSRGVGATDKGRVRDHNEDTFVVDEPLGLYLVCDGMGGHAAGEVAAEAAAAATRGYLDAHRATLAAIEDTPAGRNQLLELVRAAVREASRVVHGMAASGVGRAGMGCTLSLLLFHGRTAALAHVGDSRIYLLRGGELHALTRDHTVLEELVRKGLPRDTINPSLGHQLVRAVGPQESVEVDALVLDLVGGDRVLLCTDGLTGKGDILPELEARLASGAPPEALIAHALATGSRDNVTAVIVSVEPAAADAPDEAARDRMTLRKLSTLGRIWLFEQLSMTEISAVVGKLRPAALPAGYDIITQGEAGERLYIVLEGEVAVLQNGREVNRLGPGAHFGEMALVASRPRTATIRTLTPCQILALDKADFEALVAQHPRLGARLLWRMAEVLAHRIADRELPNTPEPLSEPS